MSRPLNKKEQKLYARMLAAGWVNYSEMHMVSMSDEEAGGIIAELDAIARKLLGSHPLLASGAEILAYVKGLRKKP